MIDKETIQLIKSISNHLEKTFKPKKHNKYRIIDIQVPGKTKDGANKPLVFPRLAELYEPYGKLSEGDKPIITGSSKPGPQYKMVPSEFLEEHTNEDKILGHLKERFKIDFRPQKEEQLSEIVNILVNSEIPLKHISANIGLKKIQVLDSDEFLAKHNNDTNAIDISAKLFTPEWKAEHPYHRIKNVPALWELLIHEIGHAVEKHYHETEQAMIDPLWHDVTGWQYPHNDEEKKLFLDKGYVSALVAFKRVPKEKMTTLEPGDREIIIERIKLKEPVELPRKRMKISWYGIVGPREDFAESYVNYILNGERFKKVESARYDYMRKYVFDGKEFEPINYNMVSKSFKDMPGLSPVSHRWEKIRDRIIDITEMWNFRRAIKAIENSSKKGNCLDQAQTNLAILHNRKFKNAMLVPVQGTETGPIHWQIELNVGSKRMVVDSQGQSKEIEKAKRRGHKEFTRIRRGKQEFIPAKGFIPTEPDKLRVMTHKAMERDGQAFLNLMSQFDRMFHKVVHHYEGWLKTAGMEHEDGMSIIKEIVLKRIHEYDPKKGAQIGTWLYELADGALKNAVVTECRVEGLTKPEMGQLRKVHAIRDDLKMKGKDPSPKNIARIGKLPEEMVKKLLEHQPTVKLDMPIGGGANGLVYIRDLITDLRKDEELTDLRIDWRDKLEQALANGIINTNEALIADLTVRFCYDNQKLIKLGFRNIVGTRRRALKKLGLSHLGKLVKQCISKKEKIIHD